MANIILIIVTSAALLLFFNWLMGHKKGNIIIDLEERHFNRNEYVAAIHSKLEGEGREVSYESNSLFLIDGKKYLFIERNVNVGGVPVQRTILQPVK
ncbi:hypothetical protein [Evansella clarkii]|uniref:hypothetical protein n=1 Tax=Evansella clarkii TaxID=79879 RepID=UPI001ADB504D|nr:hypothetical protein [Evansella clarkii]